MADDFSHNISKKVGNICDQASARFYLELDHLTDGFPDTDDGIDWKGKTAYASLIQVVGNFMLAVPRPYRKKWLDDFYGNLDDLLRESNHLL